MLMYMFRVQVEPEEQTQIESVRRVFNQQALTNRIESFVGLTDRRYLFNKYRDDFNEMLNEHPISDSFKQRLLVRLHKREKLNKSYFTRRLLGRRKYKFNDEEQAILDTMKARNMKWGNNIHWNMLSRSVSNGALDKTARAILHMKFLDLAKVRGEKHAKIETELKMRGITPYDFELPLDDIPDLFYPSKPIGSVMTGVNKQWRERWEF